MSKCFEAYVQEVGILVMLDGLDEVSTKNFPVINQAIQGLSNKLAQMGSNNIVIVTMRTQFYQQIKAAYGSIIGTPTFINKFTPSDVFEFLSRWPFSIDSREHITRIYKDLTDRPSLREMCSNPLILSMYVAEDQRSQQVVAPASRTEFYSKVTEELIVKRRFRQIGSVPAHTKLREQRERILGRLAYEHLLNNLEPQNSIQWKAAIEITKDVLGCDEVISS